MWRASGRIAVPRAESAESAWIHQNCGILVILVTRISTFAMIGGELASGSSHAGAALLAVVLIAVTPQDTAAQSGWRPASGQTQIPLWPGNPPNLRSGLGAEAVHIAVDGGTGAPKLIGGKPYSYVENVTQPTITVYSPVERNTGAAVIVYPGGG